MLDELQKRTAQAIVNIFETGRVLGDYGAVTLLRGDTGHLTYGRSQTTLASGNLYLLIRAYCDAPEAALADPLRGFLARLQRPDLALDQHATFRRLLQDAGDDPVMQRVQDAFFDRIYWLPALRASEALGFVTALATAVAYDSHVHGGWQRMRERTAAKQAGAALGETDWIPSYVEIRRSWLAAHPNALLHRTVYRMDAFQALIQSGSWALPLPLAVRGVLIDEAALREVRHARISAEDEGDAILRLRQPALRGPAVERVQQALNAQRIPTVVDGVYGSDTEQAVRTFQERSGLRVDGIVGPATRSLLAAQ